jgi:hypothetical protein
MAVGLHMLQKTLRQLREEFAAIEVMLERLRDAEVTARKPVSAEFGGGRCPSNSQLAALANGCAVRACNGPRPIRMAARDSVSASSVRIKRAQ